VVRNTTTVFLAKASGTTAAPRAKARAGGALRALLIAVAGAAVAAMASAEALAAPSGPGEPVTGSAAWFPPDSAVRSMLAARVESGQAAGIVVGLLESGKTRVVTYGKSGGPGERPLDGATVFEIGSVTKAFTATLLADMVRRGEVRLGQPVAELLPGSVKVPARGDTLITLLDLATQHSGLPRLPSNLAPKDPANPYADYTVERLYDFLSGYALTRAPGAAYEYSNLGMGLLGHALALRAGKPYEAVLTERVLKPLGMNDTRITLAADQKSRLAAGHDLGGAVTANWDLPALAGAGALRSTANDLLRFLAACLDSNDTPISADLREARRPRHPAGSPRMSIGLAWHRLDAQGAEIIMHNGATGGYHCFIGYDPAMRAAVALLSNGAGDVDDIALHLLNPKLPLRTFVKHAEVKVDTSRLDGLVGRYALAPTFVLTVTREGEGLFIQATGQGKLRVFPESDSTFFYRVVEAQVTFARDSTGKAVRLVLHQNQRDTPGARLP
jgi:CubicO group peptidase (beta-lactamase class C family)